MPRTGLDECSQAARATATLVGSIKSGPEKTIQNILITGGAGFIASWVTRHLALHYADSYHIVCLDILGYSATLKNLSCLFGMKNFSFIRGDITNEAQVEFCLHQHDIDTIIHFAALSDVDRSFDNARAYLDVNVVGTQVLLEVAARCRVKKFIHMSTDEVIGDKAYDTPLGECSFRPTNPYAASKAAAEVYVRTFSSTHGLSHIIVRSNNVYGPCQFPEKIIPRFIALIAQGKPVQIHGKGYNRRRYVYASDVADAFDIILHKGKAGHTYCITSPDEASNNEIAQQILGLFDVAPHIMPQRIQHVQDRPYNDRMYAMEGHELIELGWSPRVNLAQGLLSTKNWYEQHNGGWWSSECTKLQFRNKSLCKAQL